MLPLATDPVGSADPVPACADVAAGVGGTGKAALDYCARGLPITITYPAGTPLRKGKVSDGKPPIGTAWQNTTWTDATIRAEFVKHPGAQVGIVLGERSGLCDVEADSELEEKVFQAVFKHSSKTTPTFKSSRGHHRFYKLPTELNGAVVYVGALGVRTGRGKAAHSLVPPSSTDGHTREWLPGLSLDEVEPQTVDLRDIELVSLINKHNPTFKKILDLPVKDENDGSKRLLAAARECVRANLLDDDALTIIKVYAQVKSFPKQWDDSEILTRIRDAETRSSRKKSAEDPALQIVESARKRDELFHSPDGRGYVVTEDGDTLLIKEERYQHLLRLRFQQDTGMVPKRDWVKNAVDQLEAHAVLNGPEHEVHLRIGAHNGKVYVDLGDKDRNVIEVDKDGWRLSESAPIRFRRSSSMAPLPMPEPGGSLAELKEVVNVAEEDWPLFLGATVMNYHPTGPYPLTAIVGPPGSAKSTLARDIQDLVDPSTVQGNGGFDSVEDLMLGAQDHRLLWFDNLSKLDRKESDALCRLATGGAFERRTKYANSELTSFCYKRPVVITSVGDVAQYADLLDREI